MPLDDKQKRLTKSLIGQMRQPRAEESAGYYHEGPEQKPGSDAELHTKALAAGFHRPFSMNGGRRVHFGNHYHKDNSLQKRPPGHYPHHSVRIAPHPEHGYEVHHDDERSIRNNTHVQPAKTHHASVDAAIAHAKKCLGESVEPETFEVLVEGSVLHFPIHHRHAPVGTVHRWSDGKSYRKTTAGWEEVKAAEAPKAAAAPEKPAAPAVDLHKGIGTGTGVPTDQSTHVVKQVMTNDGTIKHARGYHTSAASAQAHADRANDYHKGHKFVVEPHVKPAAAAPAPVVATPAPKTDLPPHVEKNKADDQHDLNAKEGHETEVRWTTGSGGYHRARAVISKVNGSSVRARIVHDIRGRVGYGADAKDDVLYHAGKEIVVPRRPWTSDSWRSLGLHSKWSQSNGIFLPDAKTPARDDAAMQRVAMAAKANGSAGNYRKGDRVNVHRVDNEVHDMRVVKVEPTKNRIHLEPSHAGSTAKYGYHLDLDGTQHTVTKVAHMPVAHSDNGIAPHHVARAAVTNEPIEHRDNKLMPSRKVPYGPTHVVVRGDTGEQITWHHDPVGATENAAMLNRRHPGTKHHVDTLAPTSHVNPSDLRFARAPHEDDDYIDSAEKLELRHEPKPAHVSDALHAGLHKFAHAVRSVNYGSLRAHGYTNKAHAASHAISVKYKKGYAYVDVGSSGRYMVALGKPGGKLSHLDIGDVVGIKAYGVPHAGKRHGNVLTDGGTPGNALGY